MNRQFITTLVFVLLMLTGYTPLVGAQVIGVSSISINEGHPQRSTVTSVVIEFGSDVGAWLRNEHLIIRNCVSGQEIAPQLQTLTYDAGNRRATWTFPYFVANSLPQGNYLGILKAEGFVAPVANRQWQTPGLNQADKIFEFHVLFGDMDGDRDVDFLDTAKLQASLGLASPALAYALSLDANLDGKVDATDEAVFKANYFRILPSIAAVHGSLFNDTGLDVSDGLTFDPAIDGTVIESAKAAKLEFYFASAPQNRGTTTLANDGAFTISAAQLAAIHGGPLPQGEHDVVLRLERRDNSVEAISIPFELYSQNNAPPRITSDPEGSVAASIFTRDIELINNTTPGYYNAGIGGVLNGLLPWFPRRAENSDVSRYTQPPDLSRAGSSLGDWLRSPPDLSNPNWSTTSAIIPPQWNLEDETAVVYEIDLANPVRNAVAKFRIDNGVHIWLDGIYVGGERTVGDCEFNIGDISAGKHFLQILREDEGVINSYSVSVRGLEVLPFSGGAFNDVLFRVPGTLGDTITGTFTWTLRLASYNNEAGIYLVDDAAGRIDGIAPGEPGYARKALSEARSMTVFQSGQGAGAISATSLLSGRLYGFYLIQNNTAANVRLHNPDNDPRESLQAFFSFQEANSDGFDHLVAEIVSGTTVFRWEDLTNGDVPEGLYKDVVFTIDFEFLPVFNGLFKYSLSAIDADGDPITYTLVSGPSGVKLDPNTGVLTWEVEPGIYEFHVRASDGRGGFDNQSFKLNVLQNDVPPSISLQASSIVVDLGQDVIFQTAAMDDLGIASVTLEVNGVALLLDGNGQARMNGSVIGFLNATATAVDSSGQSTSTSTQVRVRDPQEVLPPDTGGVTSGGDPTDNTTDRPTVFFNSPAQETAITYQTPITATIRTASQIQSWRLEYAPASTVDLNDIGSSAPPWKLLGQGATAIENALVGVFDATLLRSDVYVVRLVAFNRNGRGQAEPLILNVGGNAKLGDFELEFLDLSIPLAGIPIQIRRTYNSFDASIKGDFGYGWSLGFGNPDIRETRQDTGGFFTAQPFKDGTRVYLNLPDGTRAGFTFKPELAGGSFFGTLYRPKFQADPGIQATLETPESNQAILQLDANGNARLVFIPFGYNPDTYILTTKEGIRYTYTQHEGLKEAADRNGNKLVFSADGITSSTGIKITFYRDGQGRITRIVDPDGSTMIYAYDTAGNLVSHLDRAAVAPTQFTYLANPAHYLQDVIDPRGNRAVRTEFDTNGRLIAVIDALGNRQEQNFDPANFTGTRTDGRGNVTSLVYNAFGNILTETKPEGGVTRYEYADPANPDKETAKIDPLGNRTEFTWDVRGNKLTEKDPLGTVVEYAYNALSKVTSLVRKNPQGVVLTSESAEYDSAGNLETLTNAAGDSRDFLYDERGRLIVSTDFTGNESRYDYTNGCVCGSPAKITYADGATKLFEYNASGQVTKVTDETSAVTQSAYDETGRKISETDHDGNVTRFEYDANNNQTKRIDRLGRIKKYLYNAKNELVREIKILSDDGDETNDVVLNYEYDADGHLSALVDPEGNRTRFDFDRDGRMVKRTDATLAATNVVYDLAGNTKEVIDRRGLKRSFLYDARNQPTAERWHDAGGAIIRTIGIAYDALARRTSIADPDSGLAYQYDAASRVSQVSNAGSPGMPLVVLNYVYDKDGRATLVMDNAGVSVQTTFDNRGRSDAFKWSGGGISAVSVNLDRNGRGQVTAIDRHSNATFSSMVSRTTYDQIAPQGWVKQIQHRQANGQLYNAGTNFTYGYDEEGQVKTQSSQGNSTSYGYDPTGQLLAATHSDAAYLDEIYAYDKAGNRTSSHLHGNLYRTGVANRLTTDGTFNYGYDAEGNVISKTEIATGKVTQFAYDHRGRLTSIIDRTSVGGAITDQQSFTFNALDRRIAINANGTVTMIVYNEDNAWADYTSTGAASARYLFADRIDGNLAKWATGSGTQWYLTDKLNSIRALAAAGGAFAGNLSYDSFGSKVIEGNAFTTERFGFTGREHFGSGMAFYRSRSYQSSLGRFQSEDAFYSPGFMTFDLDELIADSAMTQNLYRYVENSPLVYTDPFGYASFLEKGFLTALITNKTVRGVVVAACFLADLYDLQDSVANASNPSFELPGPDRPENPTCKKKKKPKRKRK